MKKKFNSICIFFILILGLFLPTSQNGIISEQYTVIGQILLAIFISLLLLNNGINKKNRKYFYIINMTLIIYTLINTMFYNPILEKISLGAYLPYLTLSLLFLINFENLSTKNLIPAFVFTQIIIIGAGFLVLSNNLTLDTFLVNHYSMGYENLVFNMLYFNKPVFVFGSHSIASFFYAFFFYINFQLFINNKKKYFILLSFLNIFLLSQTKSVTAYLFFVILIFAVLFQFAKTYKRTFVTVLPLIPIVIYLFIRHNSESIFLVLSSENNGILGRYSQNSVLTNNLEYIKSNFWAIGTWISSKLFFSDSGYIIHFLKGSIFLLLSVYLGMYSTIKNAIKEKRMYLPFFFLILLFELGYPILLYSRFQFIFIFSIVLLKNLVNKAPANTVTQ